MHPYQDDLFPFSPGTWSSVKASVSGKPFSLGFNQQVWTTSLSGCYNGFHGW